MQNTSLGTLIELRHSEIWGYKIMATDLSKKQFIEILLDTEITKPTDTNILQALSFDERV